MEEGEKGYWTPAWQMTSAIREQAQLDTIVGPSVWEVDPTFERWGLRDSPKLRGAREAREETPPPALLWTESRSPTPLSRGSDGTEAEGSGRCLLLLDAVAEEDRMQTLKDVMQGEAWVVMYSGKQSDEVGDVMRASGANKQVCDCTKLEAVYKKGRWETGDKHLCLGQEWTLWTTVGIPQFEMGLIRGSETLPWMKAVSEEREDLRIYYDGIHRGEMLHGAGKKDVDRWVYAHGQRHSTGRSRVGGRSREWQPVSDRRRADNHEGGNGSRSDGGEAYSTR